MRTPRTTPPREAMPPGEPATFQVDLEERISAWFGVGIFVALVGLSIAAPFLMEGSFDLLYLGFFGSVGAGGIAILQAAYAVRLGERFILTDEALVCLRPGGSIVTLPWTELTRIRERPRLQRTEVSDRTGAIVLRLHHRIEGCSVLMDEIRERRAAALQPVRLGGREHFVEELERADAAGAAPARRLHALSAALLAPLALVGSVAVFGGILVIAWVVAVGAIAAAVTARLGAAGKEGAE